ncbi:SDR family oxidoreductase [Candidatus Cyanaurora vandensis]|uniref:SDR family NAD(P)-dependent oxidoreductase n=1 Tax=Candidatus Cyanaurora vandensis TaxID=2714958 RepID=UPI002579F148|nr:SDR family oxidoreductase [Candidatus Cyanaurora vandensis]
MELTGAVVVITGASAGIGRATALALGQRGSRLVLAARTESALQEVAAEVEAAGGSALVVPTDLRDPVQVKALAQQTLAHYGRVDALINNAGYIEYGPLSEVTETQLREQFEVNVFGLLLLTQGFIPTWMSQRQGRIINLSSIAGVLTLPFEGLYHASKYAVEALSDALRMELAPFNIQVSVIQPGPVKTNFFDRAQETMAQLMPSSPYRAILPKIQSQLSSLAQQGVAAEAVTEAILKALTEDTPQDRYVVFPGGSLLLGTVRNLPTSWRDGLLKSTFGLDRPL